jgi:hypothetical protein
MKSFTTHQKSAQATTSLIIVCERFWDNIHGGLVQSAVH